MIETSPSNEHIHNEKRYSLFKNFATSPTESQVNFVMSFRNLSNYQFSYENSNYKLNNIEYTRKKIWNAVHKLKLYKRKREHQLTKESKCILYPGLSTIKQFIDAFYILLLFTDFIISPFIYFVYLAYNSKLSSIIREIIFDALFAVEIVLTFFTGYYHHSLDKIITNHKIIAKHYITHSFIIDLIAVMPFYYVFDNHNFIFIRLIKLYRYPTLISQIQYALYNIYGLCFKSFRPRTKLTEITVFIISFIYIIHLFACVYIFIGLFFLNKQHYDDTWIKHFVFDSISVLDFKHVYIIYMASMHQICQILTMLGYGDLVPITDEEKLFIMFCEIIACGLYAYLLTCLWEILLHNEHDFQSTVQLNHFKLQQWINDFVNHLPQQSNTVNLHRDELWKDVKKYFELYYQSEKNFNWINKVNYIKQIKPLQRKELLYNAFNNIRNKFSLLQNIDNLNTVHRIILQFNTIIEIKGNTIINEDDVYNKVYFIDEGNVAIIKNKMKIGQLTKGMIFGLEGLFYSKSPFTYEVSDNAKFVVLFSVDYEFLFKEVLNYDNQVFEVVQEMSNEYMKKVFEGEFDECNDNLLFEKNGSFYSRKTIVKEVVDGKRIGDDMDDDNGNLNLLGSLPKLKEMIEMYKAKEREVDEIEKRLKLIEMQLGFINDNENVCKGK